ncbi:UDP-2,4-diacetamido-2,4,6-trideoxy-beta-L-altropyranose hydrolase [Propionispira raffinosivorans]|uniref:UDP-2,4-diacetamido-2,4, 6-trideoxy-beta-L-altropyranose hydrolase n=1 Tax=Propionispira raffinosivorans TaxID=86959 RepID=UPI00037525FA|nr:UDP-2,4-diacetamido-2,4,6-trideoxy-beta-L-altropyranose hydrolase [Propionispira raffinosivorans]
MIVFRVDSSTQIGSGHLMRCLTLAGQLKKEKEEDIVFISRELEGNLNCLIMQQGYELYVLPKAEVNIELEDYEKWLTVKQPFDAEQTQEVLQQLDVAYLIVDSYAIDEIWEKVVRPYVKKIMVIDDLANRKHDCNILLDQNYYSDMKTRYNGLVSSACKMLLGPQYALLREEFYEARKKMRVRDGNIKNILVFFGGSDLTNETMKALKALTMFKLSGIQINVIVGKSNPHKGQVEVFCSQYNGIQYFCQVDNIAEFMNEADLAIGAGGTTTWERCFLGLPTIVIAIAENQITGSRFCGEKEVIYYAGFSNQITVQRLYNIVCKLFNDKTIYDVMINRMKKNFYNKANFDVNLL